MDAEALIDDGSLDLDGLSRTMLLAFRPAAALSRDDHNGSSTEETKSESEPTAAAASQDFDLILHQLCRHALVLALRLGEEVRISTTPLSSSSSSLSSPVSARDVARMRLDTMVTVFRIQETLGKVTELLVSILDRKDDNGKDYPYAAGLERTRSGGRWPDPAASASSSVTSVPSPTATLHRRHSSGLRHKRKERRSAASQLSGCRDFEPLLSCLESERHVIVDFLATAEGLRSLISLLSRENVLISKSVPEGSSSRSGAADKPPALDFDTGTQDARAALSKIARAVDSVALGPFDSEHITSLRSLKNADTTGLPSDHYSRQAGISAMRWQAALIVETVKALVAGRRSEKPGFKPVLTPTMITTRSSFKILTSQVEFITHPFYPLIVILPSSFRCACVQAIVSASASFVAPRRLSQNLTLAFTSGATRLGSEALATVRTADGGSYRVAIFFVTISILLNHCRRFLYPWLAAYVYHHPVDELRLALSRPDLFLHETIAAVPWSTTFFMYTQRAAFDVAGVIVMAYLSFYIPSSTDTQPDVNRKRKRPTYLLDIARIAFFLWTYATAEYIFQRVAHTIAVLISYRSLLHRNSLHTVLLTQSARSPSKLVLHLIQLFCNISGCLLLLLRSTFVDLALRINRNPIPALILASLASTVWLVLRYRSAMYLPLEMVGLFIALGHGAVAAVALVCEMVRDPLALEARGRVEGRRMARASARVFLAGGDEIS